MTTLSPTEPHPAARDAFAWLKDYLAEDTVNAHILLEGFASVGMSGNRLAEICGETLRRVLAGETVSDRYLLGLTWTLKEMAGDQHEGKDSVTTESLADYNNDRLLWKWAKHIDERLAQTEESQRIGLIRDKLRDFQRVCEPVRGAAVPMPSRLDAATKHAIADNISIEGRSKTDVVQDVWDEIMERFPNRESIARCQVCGADESDQKRVQEMLRAARDKVRPQVDKEGVCILHKHRSKSRCASLLLFRFFLHCLLRSGLGGKHILQAFHKRFACFIALVLTGNADEPFFIGFTLLHGASCAG